jgi:TolB-like protein/DNA-binding SARP family transcriptional activator/Tfp pilus assembly protein PilF
LFRLTLFGSASIEGPGGPLTGRPVQRRRLALLALLALARQRGLTRDKLVGYLWPDTDPERARRLLSDSLYRVNQAVEGEALVAFGDELRLDPRVLPSDAWEFAQAMEGREWARAVELHVAPFLDGFLLPGADELERWVDAQRERLAHERGRALEALAEVAERDDDLPRAVQWWRALAGHDPYSSRVALRLVRALDRTGDAAAALRHARSHALLLKEELGLEPDGDLLAFAAELQARTPAAARPAGSSRAVSAAPGGTRPGSTPEAGGIGAGQAAATMSAAPAYGTEPSSAPARSAPAGDLRSVAVLPFLNLSADPENGYFADGITEDVIAQLSKIGALHVLSRASVLRLVDQEQTPRAIGAALGAGSLLAGSVRRAGDRVRVVAQLVEAETGQCLWAETYDRRVTDVFAIQTDVALHIATALHAQLSPDERSRLGKEPTRDLRAYQLYVQGRHWFVQYTAEGMRKGIGYFERALELDPGYALAWAGIAMAYEALAETGLMEPDEAYPRARRAAEQAVRLDDGLAEAHCILGQLAAVCDFDWEGAERAFRRALELSPSNADTYDLYGRMCAALGRHDESIAMEQRAQELDPLAHPADYATALIRAGRYAEAVQAAERAVEFDPRYDRGRATLGWACLKLGDAERGLAELGAAVALSPANTGWLAQLGEALALAGRPDEARAILARLEDLARVRYVPPYHIAYVLTGLGEYDRAIDALERACRERDGAIYGVKGSFLFTPLHDHPRFTRLLRRMRLA